MHWLYLYSIYTLKCQFEIQVISYQNDAIEADAAKQPSE